MTGMNLIKIRYALTSVRVLLETLSNKGKISISINNTIPNNNGNNNNSNTHNNDTHVCVSGINKCSFETFGMHFFLVTPFLRFAFLPYYQRFRALPKAVNYFCKKTLP